jgi:hypothetical protein
MSNPVRILPTAALAAAALIPATANAATTVGSSFDTSRGAPTTLQCGGCTFAMSTVDSLPLWTDPGIVTSFRAELAAGTTAKLRVFTRDGDSTFTPVGTSAQITGNGQRESYTVHLPVPANATIGLDLNGAIAAIDGTGETYVNGSLREVEPLLSATVENDYDNDGLGDDSEDQCVFCPADSGGGSGNGGGSPTPPPAGDGGGSSGSGSQSPPAGRDPMGIRSRTTFTIQDSGLVTLGRKPVARVWLFNPHNDSLSGSATLTVGGRKVATRKVFVISHDAVEFKLSAKVARALRRGAKATVTATAGGERDTTAVKFVAPATTAFDGTWRGAGPLVIKIRGGVVETASRAVFLSSTRGSGNMTRTFALPTGVPAVIGRDGTVKVHGDFASDEVRFEATFRRNGTAKGYLSLWYTQLGINSDGKLVADPYLGASNWTAKRVSR